MNKSPTLSVVVPMYNEKDLIRNCIDALERLSHNIEEVIIVNNASTDGCDEIVKNEYPNVTLLHEPKQGIVYARNTGFNHANSDIIAKIDADTVVNDGWAQGIIHDFMQYNCDGWSGTVGSYEINPIMAPITEFFFDTYVFTLNRIVSGSPMLLGCNMALSKTCWKAIKSGLHMRNDIWEDLDMASEAAVKELKVHTNYSRLACISLRSANTSIVRMTKRSYGMSRVYWIRKKYVSYTVSLLFLIISVITWMILTPLSFVGQKIGKRPRPDQY